MKPDHPSWVDPFQPTVDRQDPFAVLIENVRAVQESVTSSKPTKAAADQASLLLTQIQSLLAPFEVTEDDQIAGRLWDLAGRAQALTPVLHIADVTTSTARGWFTVGRFHSGRYAMNGGVTPLIFDEIMARLANSNGRVFARTACLTVNYRAPAPLGQRLRVEARIVGQQGRKRFLEATISSGDQSVIADAEGLWVQTAPRDTSEHASAVDTQPSSPQQRNLV